MKLSQVRTYAIRFLFTLSLMLGNATFVWSDAPDPTTPSPQIVKRLAQDTETTNPPVQATQRVATRKLPPPRLRLKAIVLRDNDNGTALISSGGSEVYVVKLRRMELNAATNQFNIGGSHLAVKDFSKSTVFMYSLDTNRDFIIN